MSLGKAVVEVGADASGFGRDLSKEVDKAAQSADRSLSKIGKGTAGVGKRLTLGLTTPILGIGVAAVKSQANFEQAINLLGVNAGIGGASLTKMADQAKQLGADTVFSASEAADAMLELAKAGFKPAEISGGGVQATMALAATEGLNLADAATITGNAMNSFGIKAKNAGTIADALAGASAASSASVESLSQALSQVGPGAKNAGLSLQDTVGVLAAFDQAGIKGSDAGTSLKTMLTRLIPQTKQSATAMEKLGLFSKTTGSAFVDNKGNFKNIADVAGILHKKLGGLSEAQRTTALQTIFGSDATRAATVLLNDGRKGIEKYITAATKQGTAQKLADARMKGTAGAIEQMKGSIDTASIALGEALAPTVVKVAGKIQGLANWFSHLDSGTQHTVGTVLALVAAAGPLLLVTGKLITAFGQVNSVIGKVSTSMATSEGKGIALARAVQGLAGAGGLLLLSKSMTQTDQDTKTLQATLGGAATGFALGGPVGGAIGALGGLTLSLATHTQTAADKWKAARDEAFQFGKTLDTVTAKITKETDAQVLSALTKQTAAIPAAQALGVSQQTLVKYVEGSAKAQAKVNEALAIGAKSGVMMTYANGGMARASDVLTQALGDQGVETAKGIGKIDGITTAFGKQRAEALHNAQVMAKYKGALKDIPAEVKTRLLDDNTTNVRLSELETLIDRYHKTPKEVRTLVKLSGQEVSKAEMRALISYADELGSKRPTVKVNADTAGARAKVSALVSDIHNLLSGNFTALVTARTSGPGKPKTAVGGVFSGAQSRIIAEAGREAVVPLDRNLSSVSPSVRYLSAVAQGKVLPLPKAYSSTRSTAAAPSQQSVQLVVNNPVPETTTQSLPRALANLAFVVGG